MAAKQISAEEFDRMFDEGGDISDYVDWEHPVVEPGVGTIERKVTDEGVVANPSDSLGDEEQTLVSIRIPCSQAKAIESAVEKRGITKSEFFRRAVEHELDSLN